MNNQRRYRILTKIAQLTDLGEGISAAANKAKQTVSAAKRTYAQRNRTSKQIIEDMGNMASKELGKMGPAGPMMKDSFDTFRIANARNKKEQRNNPAFALRNKKVTPPAPGNRPFKVSPPRSTTDQKSQGVSFNTTGRGKTSRFADAMLSERKVGVPNASTTRNMRPSNLMGGGGPSYSQRIKPSGGTNTPNNADLRRRVALKRISTFKDLRNKPIFN